MEEWKEYKIGDICKIKHGFAFKGIHFVDEPQKYVCVTPGNFALKGGFKNDKPKYYNGPIPEDYVLFKDDLVVTMTDLSKNGDTLGYSALIPEDDNYIFLHNQRIGLIEKISQEIDKHFLYWVMRTYDYQRYIVGRCSGSTVKHTSPSGIGSYIFRCPDIKMQREISSILDNLDNKIAINKKICENLEAQAQALFKNWFVDFAPFKDGEFVESELGLIPEGWRVGGLFDIAEVHDSKRKPLSGMQRAKMKKVYPYYGATEQMDMVDDYIFDGRYVLMGEDGSVVRENGLPYIQYVWGKIWVNNHAHVLTGKNGFTTEMLIPFLTTYNIKGLVTGAVQAKLNQANMAKISLAIPPMSILENISVLFESLYDTYRNCCTEIVTLSTLRDTLLPKLMSGEIKV